MQQLLVVFGCCKDSLRSGHSPCVQIAVCALQVTCEERRGGELGDGAVPAVPA